MVDSLGAVVVEPKRHCYIMSIEVDARMGDKENERKKEKKGKKDRERKLNDWVNEWMSERASRARHIEMWTD